MVCLCRGAPIQIYRSEASCDCNNKMGGCHAAGNGIASWPPALPPLLPPAVNILEGLAKTRHPAAKAATQAPTKQGVAS